MTLLKKEQQVSLRCEKRAARIRRLERIRTWKPKRKKIQMP